MNEMNEHLQYCAKVLSHHSFFYILLGGRTAYKEKQSLYIDFESQHSFCNKA